VPRLILDPQDGTPPLVLDWRDGYGVQEGPLGLGVPPRDLIQRDRPDGHGADLVGVRVGPRDITIPLDVYALDRPTFLRRRRRLQQICGRSTQLRPVRVIYEEDDGATEWVEGVYAGGLEGDGKDDGRSELFGVTLRAGSPYWRLPALTESWGLTPPVRRNWFPLLGRSPQSSVVGGRRLVDIAGDVEIRPPWVVQGPGTRLLIVNHTAGWRVDISHPIPADGPASVITVNTASGGQSVRDGYNNNLFDRITNGDAGGWEMGPLLPGVNDVEVLLEDSGDQSDVAFTYHPLQLAV
jgi:hypothetical protein